MSPPRLRIRTLMILLAVMAVGLAVAPGLVLFFAITALPSAIIVYAVDRVFGPIKPLWLLLFFYLLVAGIACLLPFTVLPPIAVH